MVNSPCILIVSFDHFAIFRGLRIPFLAPHRSSKLKKIFGLVIVGKVILLQAFSLSFARKSCAAACDLD